MQKLIYLFLFFIVGCSSSGITGNAHRQTGVIEEIVEIPRVGESTPGLFFLGLLGDIVSTIQSAPYSSYKYTIKTELGKMIYAEVDSSFTVGECVDVIPLENVNTTYFYAYGESRVTSSDKCKTKV